MSGRWLLLLLLLVAPSQAWAAVDDVVSVTQVVAPATGPAVMAQDLSRIAQSGSNNFAQTQQTSLRDVAAITQTGKGDYSLIQQTGSRDSATINQIGNGLSLTIHQTGSGQSVAITQRR